MKSATSQPANVPPKTIGLHHVVVLIFTVRITVTAPSNRRLV